MVSLKNGIKPCYVICNLFDSGNLVYHIITNFINQGNTVNDIAILGKTLSYNTPIMHIANFLSSKGYNIYNTNTNNGSTDILLNKITISSIHKFKGREKKMIIIVGFDESYFHESEKNRDKCPNSLYVACSRATERLFLLHHDSRDFLPFLNKEKLGEYADVYGEMIQKKSEYNRKTDYTVLEFIKNVPDEVYIEIKKHVDVKIIKSDLKNDYEDRKIIKFNEINEDVSYIYSLAILAYKVYSITGKCIIKNKLLELREVAERLKIMEIYNDAIKGKYHLPLMCNICYCLQNKYMPLLKQIEHYKWFDYNFVESCSNKNMPSFNSNDLFEHRIVHDYEEITLFGVVNCIENNEIIWMFKIDVEITDFDLLEAIIYGVLAIDEQIPVKIVKILNVIDKTVYEIKINNHIEIMNIMMKYRNGEYINKPLNDLVDEINEMFVK